MRGTNIEFLVTKSSGDRIKRFKLDERSEGRTTPAAMTLRCIPTTALIADTLDGWQVLLGPSKSTNALDLLSELPTGRDDAQRSLEMIIFTSSDSDRQGQVGVVILVL